MVWSGVGATGCAATNAKHTRYLFADPSCARSFSTTDVDVRTLRFAPFSGAVGFFEFFVEGTAWLSTTSFGEHRWWLEHDTKMSRLQTPQLFPTFRLSHQTHPVNRQFSKTQRCFLHFLLISCITKRRRPQLNRARPFEDLCYDRTLQRKSPILHHGASPCDIQLWRPSVGRLQVHRSGQSRLKISKTGRCLTCCWHLKGPLLKFIRARCWRFVWLQTRKQKTGL